VAALTLLVCLPSSASDQQKAEKQLRKVTAMCADASARSIVSRTMADLLNVKRGELVRQRRNLNLSYGDVFLAHQLMGTGMGIADIVAAQRAGEDLAQMVEEQHADWKLIAASARKLNARIEDNIYRHYLNKKNTELDEARDVTERYQPDADWVNADRNTTPAEVAEAAASFDFWRRHAGENNFSKGLTLAEEKAAAYDPMKIDHSRDGQTAPTAGGAPPK
jgi:hypothetical protein